MCGWKGKHPPISPTPSLCYINNHQAGSLTAALQTFIQAPDSVLLLVAMSPLLALLGAALCSLVMSAEVVPQADFNIQGVAGKWYLIGFATNARWFVTRKATMKMGTAMLKPTAEGDLDLSYASLNSDGSCWRKNNLAKKTDVPGKFTYVCQRWGSENDMRVVDVKYDEYALIYTIKKKQGETTALTKLYGRGEEVSADVMEKFRQLSLNAGTLPENIVFLPRNGECPAA